MLGDYCGMAFLCREWPAKTFMVAVFCVTFRFLLLVCRGKFLRTFLRTALQYCSFLLHISIMYILYQGVNKNSYYSIFTACMCSLVFLSLSFMMMMSAQLHILSWLNIALSIFFQHMLSPFASLMPAAVSQIPFFCCALLFCCSPSCLPFFFFSRKEVSYLMHFPLVTYCCWHQHPHFLNYHDVINFGPKYDDGNAFCWSVSFLSCLLTPSHAVPLIFFLVFCCCLLSHD